jgi:hypothetical protein
MSVSIDAFNGPKSGLVPTLSLATFAATIPWSITASSFLPLEVEDEPGAAFMELLVGFCGWLGVVIFEELISFY